MSDSRVRVVVADDHAIVRTGLRAVLGLARDIELVGEAKTGAEAVMLAHRLLPDVIVMDLEMPELDGASALKEIVSSNLSCRVLVLSMHAEGHYLSALIGAGAAGYLVKDVADLDLVDAIRVVAQGGLYLRPSAARMLANGSGTNVLVSEERARFDKLAQRDRDVLLLISRGHTATEIAERLSISPMTVVTSKQRLHKQLGLSHRSEYVQTALRLGLLQAD